MKKLEEMMVEELKRSLEAAKKDLEELINDDSLMPNLLCILIKAIEEELEKRKKGEEMDKQKLFRKFVKEVIRQIKPAILGKKWYEIYKAVGLMPDCECWKASLLGTLSKLKISKLAFANMFLILSRVEDDFDLFMQSHGFEKLVGKRFFEEMSFCLIEGLKLNSELADRAIILKSDITY